ncbi:(2Fe-2S)-binding protein [Streptomyces olivochromogenes]|uniref:(2Fe-2S)-binding protein n=1 Tax=Streptomyces olivochromogenes TaxID=1963 RepID=UPI001F3B9ACC|nr:(2Fe-2S)-binding protein [Streptomyces olivochromogenes]MCF3133591.1 (2Fe-2S)-binding protein [Streptomyces olivochromogenes]
MDLDPDLAALRALGGFFVLRTAEDSARGRIPTLAESYGQAKSDVYGSPLTFRVEVVGQRLRTREPRVAASIAHQGLAARLWSVALGCAALHGRLPDLEPALLRWDAAAAAPDDLWLTEVRPLPGDAAGLTAAVLDGHLRPLGEALRGRYGVATGLLWGNAGSALAGAARELDRWARAAGRTDVADRARTLTAELFEHPLLSATGTLTGTPFRRRSCCLYYRVPGGGLCGDCCFTRPPRSSPGAASG